MAGEREKELIWVGSAYDDLVAMPEEVKDVFGHGLNVVQQGGRPEGAKKIGAVMELIDDYDSDTYRAVYTTKLDDDLYVLHCYMKKSTKGKAIPKHVKKTIDARLKDAASIAASRRKVREESGKGR